MILTILVMCEVFLGKRIHTGCTMEYFFDGLRLNGFAWLIEHHVFFYMIIDCGSDLSWVQARNLHILLPSLIIFIPNSKTSMYKSWLLGHYEIIIIRDKVMQHIL